MTTRPKNPLDELVNHVAELNRISQAFNRLSKEVGSVNNGFRAFAAFADEVQFGPKKFTPAAFNKRWKRLQKQDRIDYVLYLIS